MPGVSRKGREAATLRLEQALRAALRGRLQPSEIDHVYSEIVRLMAVTAVARSLADADRQRKPHGARVLKPFKLKPDKSAIDGGGEV